MPAVPASGACAKMDGSAPCVLPDTILVIPP